MEVKVTQVSAALLCSFSNCPGSSHILGAGSVLLNLFLEVMKSPFGGAQRPIPGVILREKLLLPELCSCQQFSGMECIMPLL